MSKIFKILSFVILPLLFSCNSNINAEKQPNTFEKEVDESMQKQEEEMAQNDCVYRKTEQLRSNTFPFDACDKIELVSHPAHEIDGDSVVVNGKFTVPNIQETYELNSEQIDSLFSILYYHSSKVENPISFPLDCGFNPRHTLIFSKKNKVISTLEVCLECQVYRSNNAGFGDFCNETWCNLFDFFKWVGIKNGFEISAQQCS